MKLLKYISEVKDTFWEDGGNDIFNNCMPFINELKKAGMLLLRGTKKRLPKDVNLVSARTDRHPLSSTVEFHDYCDLKLGEMFGWYPRSGGVFAKTGSIPSAYGTPYVFFIPGRNLKYIWSPLVYDLYTLNCYFRERELVLDKKMLDRIRNSVTNPLPEHLLGKTVGDAIDYALSTYTDNNLTEAIQSRHEIMFKCDKYYMVNTIHDDKLNELIFEIMI